MMLLGAEVLFYPTAIGSEPHEPDLDTRDPWQRAMVGHAVSNIVPVVAANRIGSEDNQTFYGSSFISNARGDKVAELGRKDEDFIVATFTGPRSREPARRGVSSGIVDRISTGDSPTRTSRNGVDEPVRFLLRATMI